MFYCNTASLNGAVIDTYGAHSVCKMEKKNIHLTNGHQLFILTSKLIEYFISLCLSDLHLHIYYIYTYIIYVCKPMAKFH